MENELIFQTPQVGNQFLRDTSFSPLNLTYSYGLQPRIGKNFEFLDGGGVGALGVWVIRRPGSQLLTSFQSHFDTKNNNRAEKSTK